MTSLQRLLLAAAAVLCAPAARAAPPDDTLVLGISSDASTFDPDNIAARDNSNIARQIFGTLYKVDDDGKIVPDLAESYTQAEDGLSITYKIKPTATCEDGSPFTAEDAAYTFNRAADRKNGFTGSTPGFVYSSIGFKNAEALSRDEVKVSFATKSSVNPGLLAEVYMVCKAPYEKMSLDQASVKPVGTGSYRLVSWDRGSQIVLEKVKDPGAFKRIVFRIIPEASTRSAELIAGNVDIATNVAPDQVPAVNGSGTAEVKIVQGTRRMYVGFNQKASFGSTPGGAAIQKPAVRRALQYAVDVPTICEQLLQFKCERATSLVNPPNGNKALIPYPYDPDKAGRLLDEAGYPKGPDGTRFTLKLQGPRGRYLNDANVVQAIGQYLDDVGVKTDVEIMEFASVYVPLLSKHDAGPLFFLGSGGGLWSALYDMTDIPTAEAGTNYANWNNKEWLDGWAKISAAKTPQEERSVIDAMLKVFYDDSPWLLLYFQPDFYGVSHRVEFKPRHDEEWDLTEVTLKR